LRGKEASIGVSGGEKIKRKKTLWEKVTDSEAAFNEADLEETFWKENEEPWDLADKAYEQWRDERRSSSKCFGYVIDRAEKKMRRHLIYPKKRRGFR
jgi:hypothetical protein